MSGLAGLTLLGFLLTAQAVAQPKRVLYVTHSAGFRHDSIPTSTAVLTQAAAATGKLQIVQTEDLSLLSQSNLASFDAVLFFTSGELPISDVQKQDLLNFVHSGKGFGGVHSATDTFYTWPDYGDLIGARFNGHPWVQQVTLDVEDPAHPAVAQLAPGFSILEEIYQFREFSRDRVRVLLTLDTHSVNLAADGVNPGTEDFPLAWCRNYGTGRVFYTALGHFTETWQDSRFSGMVIQALLWLTGQTPGDATLRTPGDPALAPNGIANSASLQPPLVISPGSLITLFGTNLTPGSTSIGLAESLPYKLAGATVKLNGAAIPLLFASPSQINAYVPIATPLGQAGYSLQVSTAGKSAMATVSAVPATPGIFATPLTPGALTLWATGLGAVKPNGSLQVTTLQPIVTINGLPARVLFSGLAPIWPGLYQVNVELSPTVVFPASVQFRFGDYQTTLIVGAKP